MSCAKCKKVSEQYKNTVKKSGLISCVECLKGVISSDINPDRRELKIKLKK